jgi:Tol biopolymer transport system component
MAVSPDGRTAVIAGAPFAAGDLYEVDLRSGRMTQLTHTARRFERAPVYLSDRRVAFGYQTLGTPEINGRIAVMDIKSRRVITVSPSDQIAGWPTALVGMTRVVYDAETGGRHAIWEVPATGGTPKRLLTIAATYPSLRRDGSILVRLQGVSGAKTLRIVSAPGAIR